MRLLLIGLLATIVAGLATAQDQPGSPPNSPFLQAGISATEPPSGRVGRISFTSGDVSVGMSDSWVDAVLNRPFAPGNALRTGTQARAEIDLGAEIIDLDHDTEVNLTGLGDAIVLVSLVKGRVGLALRQLDSGERVEIEVSGKGVRLLQPGFYEVDAAAPRIAVFNGRARLLGSTDPSDITSGNVAFVGDSTEFAIEPAARDPFVDWCQSRDSAGTSTASAYYVSPYMTGSTELDAEGRWDNTAEYGAVWFPHELPTDWAPYRDGHWNWMTPWGWTWIDDHSWGFAPFHYGRWAFVGGRWAWVPGTFVAHPVFAPAVVAFLGTVGVGLSVADSNVPAVAWFPLAPGETYWPAYTSDLNYVRRLNLGNIRDVETIRLQPDGEPPLEVFDEHFANRRFAIVVPRPIFVNGGAVASALLSLPEQRLENAPVLMGSPQIGPAKHRVIVIANPAPRSAARTEWTSHIAALVARNASRSKALQAAFARQHDRGAVAQVRGAHLRAPAYAGSAPGRHTIVLRVAHAAKVSRR
jgi:hypothetical protein